MNSLTMNSLTMNSLNGLNSLMTTAYQNLLANLIIDLIADFFMLTLKRYFIGRTAVQLKLVFKKYKERHVLQTLFLT